MSITKDTVSFGRPGLTFASPGEDKGTAIADPRDGVHSRPLFKISLVGKIYGRRRLSLRIGASGSTTGIHSWFYLR